MLSEILRILQTAGPQSLSDLARRCRVETAAMEGMLQTLEAKGRIERIGGGKCAGCKGCLSVNPADVLIYRIRA